MKIAEKKLMIIMTISFLFSFNSLNSQTLEMQEALDLLNKVRANPSAYSNEIGVSLNNVNSLHPLKWNINLASAAQRKAQEMADRNYFAHVNPYGYGMNYFIQNTGYQLNPSWTSNISMNNFESLSAGESNPLNSIISLIKDEGVVGYGHRKHLLGMNEFWEPCYDIGIGWGYNPNSKYKTYCCVLIAKHDYNGYNSTKSNNSTQYNYPTNNNQNQNQNQTIYYYPSPIVPVYNTQTKYNKLFTLKIGSSAILLVDDFSKLNSTFNDQLSYQINTMFGVNLGKSKKNTTLGLFGNYGEYNINNTTILNNNLFNSTNHFLEIEGGFLFKEFLRISGGVGYSDVNTFNLSSYNYSSISSGFSFGPKWLKFDLMNTFIIPRNNQKVIYRPSVGISIVINFWKKNSKPS